MYTHFFDTFVGDVIEARPLLKTIDEIKFETFFEKKNLQDELP